MENCNKPKAQYNRKKGKDNGLQNKRQLPKESASNHTYEVGEPLPSEVLQFIRYCMGIISLPQNLDQQTDTDLKQM